MRCDWKYGPSSQSIPSQRSPSRIPSTISGEERSKSVSSMRRTSVPPQCRSNSQLNSAVRAPPTWRYPVGEGAKRRRTSGLDFAGVELMDDGWDYPLFPFSRFSIFAQVSSSGTVRLKNSAPGFESGSTQKYPSRSNWQRSPGFALASDGSSLAFVNTSSDPGLRLAVNS